MSIYFSKSTNGFYSDEIHGENIPEDSVEISQEKHVELLNGQSEGKIITSDESGYPILQDPPEPTEEELINSAKATINAELSHASIIIAPLVDLESLEELTPDETTKLKAWRKYRIDISRVPQQEGYPKTIIWPSRPE